MNRHPQQTIKLAIDCETGELVTAESLLLLDEEKFVSLRRSTLEARNERKKGSDRIRFQCAICKKPVFLSRYRKESYKNRWFVHDGMSEDCPWHENNRLSAELIKALIYRGQQEGSAHRAMKSFLADWLNKDPFVSSVVEEQTTYSEVVKGEWRRPDVKCVYQGRTIVFEIQLSYVFLSDVIARDAFYRRDGIFVIWVFASVELNRAAVIDEAFFNRRNLFILDTDAMAQTMIAEKLTFSGYRQEPKLVGEKIVDEWECELVGLSNVTFPVDTYRPYFFDYAAKRIAIETRHEQIDLFDYEKEWESTEWRTARGILDGKIESYLKAAIHYYDSDYSKGLKGILLDEAKSLSDEIMSFDKPDVLCDERFFGYHEILPVLLSIKENRNVGFDKSFTVYQVVEAGTRNSSGQKGRKPLAILYFWAVKAYGPTLTDKNRVWIRKFGTEIKDSIEQRKETYRRITIYDETISMLFPELSQFLASEFGK
ncbi:MAG: hypothetical protein DID91_2727704197 [Candidatus Nitrotoga sp. MKT]|nr:MAG: hypothetical protein DID91_2727704197 [Candidatus Nitrotoga sp. MKT]